MLPRRPLCYLCPVMAAGVLCTKYSISQLECILIFIIYHLAYLGAMPFVRFDVVGDVGVGSCCC